METLLSSQEGIDILQRGHSFFVRYDSGHFAINMREDEISREEALRAQQSLEHAYQVVLAVQQRTGQS